MLSWSVELTNFINLFRVNYILLNKKKKKNQYFIFILIFGVYLLSDFGKEIKTN